MIHHQYISSIKIIIISSDFVKQSLNVANPATPCYSFNSSLNYGVYFHNSMFSPEVIVEPGCNSRLGEPYEAIARCLVTDRPPFCPYEERHQHTLENTSNDT